MRVLVIDTALGACTAAVFDGDRCLAARSEPMGKGHQERLGGLVRDVAAEAGGFEAVDRIGVTVGPGSFTGLRVGLAFAQGLGAALGRPVVGISTLAALAWSADGGRGRTMAAIDARRGQVYVQASIDGLPANDPQALPIETASDLLNADGGGWLCAGSGAALITPEPTPTENPPAAWPTPSSLAALTIAADPAVALPRPLYLRAPDAVPPTRLPGQPRTPVARPESPAPKTATGHDA